MEKLLTDIMNSKSGTSSFEHQNDISQNARTMTTEDLCNSDEPPSSVAAVSMPSNELTSRKTAVFSLCADRWDATSARPAATDERFAAGVRPAADMRSSADVHTATDVRPAADARDDILTDTQVAVCPGYISRVQIRGTNGSEYCPFCLRYNSSPDE